MEKSLSIHSVGRGHYTPQTNSTPAQLLWLSRNPAHGILQSLHPSDNDRSTGQRVCTSEEDDEDLIAEQQKLTGRSLQNSTRSDPFSSTASAYQSASPQQYLIGKWKSRRACGDSRILNVHTESASRNLKSGCLSAAHTSVLLTSRSVICLRCITPCPHRCFEIGFSGMELQI